MIKFAVASDIHLGHPRVPTENIIKGLEAAFPDNSETAELDIIFFAGDVFDRLLDLPDDSTMAIQLWIARLFRICEQGKIKLRVLEGTRSHDREQSELFRTVHEAIESQVDFKYVKKLSIEHIEDLGLRILYMPDNWNFEASKTLEEAQALLAAEDLTTVDLGIFHGAFEYQLPKVAQNAATHDSASYLRLVSKLIFVGHVHNFSCFDRIYAQGSLDRLSHGEEHAKGHLRCFLFEDGTYHVDFIENHYAHRWMDIQCEHLSLEEIMAQADAMATELPPGSGVRLVCTKAQAFTVDPLAFTRMYPLISWSRSITKDKDSLEERVRKSPESVQHTPVHITPDNVVDMVMAGIIARCSDAALVAATRTHLLELK